MGKHSVNNNVFNKRAFTIGEAAEYACVSQGTIKNWLLKRLLPFEELPSRGKGSYSFRRIRKVDLDIFLDKFYQQYSQNAQRIEKKKLSEIFLLPRDA